MKQPGNIIDCLIVFRMNMRAINEIPPSKVYLEAETYERLLHELHDMSQFSHPPMQGLYATNEFLFMGITIVKGATQ